MRKCSRLGCRAAASVLVFFGAFKGLPMCAPHARKFKMARKEPLPAREGDDA